MGQAAKTSMVTLARRYISPFAVSILIGLGACASPGPPRPPSLNLPEVPSSLIAERVGDQVELRWDTPEKTTDGLNVRGPMTAVVCRRMVANPEPACVPVFRMIVAAGPFTTIDQLPPALTAGQPEALEYRLEIINAKGHSAGPSPSAFTATGPAPLNLRTLQVKATPEGAELQWQGDAGRDAIEVHRLRTYAVGSSDHPGKKAEEAPNATLRVPAGTGALDRTARMGDHYIYTAQRVQRVTLAGHVLEIRSLVSAPVDLKMRDSFPPRQPTGVEAVAGDHSIDLSWQPNSDPDLAGYYVVRYETGVPTILNETPLQAPAFQDTTISSGHTYLYRVTAVDQAGNRSLASESTAISFKAAVP